MKTLEEIKSTEITQKMKDEEKSIMRKCGFFIFSPKAATKEIEYLQSTMKKAEAAFNSQPNDRNERFVLGTMARIKYLEGIK